MWVNRPVQSDSSAGPFDPVGDGSAIMSPSNRLNPSSTTADGAFAWDVIAGFYRVEASKPGCVTASSPVFEVPPPATGIVLKLACGRTQTLTFAPIADRTLRKPTFTVKHPPARMHQQDNDMGKTVAIPGEP